MDTTPDGYMSAYAPVDPVAKTTAERLQMRMAVNIGGPTIECEQRWCNRATGRGDFVRLPKPEHWLVFNDELGVEHVFCPTHATPDLIELAKRHDARQFAESRVELVELRDKLEHP